MRKPTIFGWLLIVSGVATVVLAFVVPVAAFATGLVFALLLLMLLAEGTTGGHADRHGAGHEDVGRAQAQRADRPLQARATGMGEDPARPRRRAPRHGLGARAQAARPDLIPSLHFLKW